MMCIRWVIIISVSVLVCEGEPASVCDRDEFPCNDGTCIEKSRWCDSVEDCDDDSDELYCLTKSGLIANPNRCDETFFLCKDGRCIPSVGRCDGYRSCYDNSDEEDCGAIHLNDTLTFLSTTMKTRSVTDLPMTTTDIQPRNHSTERLESSSPHELLQADFAENSDYNSSSRAMNLHTSTELSVSDNTNTDISNEVELHDDILEVSVLRNNRSSSTTVKTDLHLEVTTPVDNTSNVPEQVNPVKIAEFVTSILQNTDQDVPLKSGIQADSSAQNAVSSKQEDLRRGFTELRSRDFRREKARAQQWLLKVREADYGWGEETARALIAVYMSDEDFIKKHYNENLLMSKQLHLKLFTEIVRNETASMSLGELSLFINALAASCDNPKNFYGQNLVSVLRHRTDAAQTASKFISPLVYLTLCTNNLSTYTDIRKIQEIIYGPSKIDKIDIAAIVSLAATCISKNPKFSGYGIGQAIVKTLYQKIIAEGLPENVYELSLVAQALNEARINQNLWNRSEVLALIVESQQLDGSFGDILSTYYAVPILSGRSLVSLRQHCDKPQDQGLLPLEVLKNGKDEKTYVHYSLYFGNPVEVSQSIMMKVQKSVNFLDIMRLAETVNPAYRFRYDMSSGKPTVYSIGGIVNDAERGLYWTLHVSSQQNSTKENLVPYEGDIRSFIPSIGEYVVFWMKPVL